MFVAPPQTPGLVVLNCGAIVGPKTTPKREFFTENKEGWLGELAVAAAKM